MTSKELDLTIKMLEAYSDHLSCAGCNDTPREWLEPFTKPELVQINREYNEFNGSPEEDDGDRHLSDFCYVGLMQDKLRRLKGGAA